MFILLTQPSPAGEGDFFLYLTALFLSERAPDNAVDLCSAKPSPAGEGWVRGNKNKEYCNHVIENADFPAV